MTLYGGGLYLITHKGVMHPALYGSEEDAFFLLRQEKGVKPDEVDDWEFLGIPLLVGGAGDTPTLVAFAQVLAKAFELFKVKHQSYGPNNISAFGERGVFVRVWDKFMRLRRLVWQGLDNPLPETIEDSWLDVLNYSAIALVLRDGDWPDFTLGD